MIAEIELKSSGEKLLVTDLSIHLLKEQHFIEGIGSQFRLEPELVKRVLFRKINIKNSQLVTCWLFFIKVFISFLYQVYPTPRTSP